MKRIFSAIVVMALLLLLPLSVSAHDYVQLDKEGSVTLELKYKGEAVTGGKFSCIQVAEVVEEDGNYYFKTLHEGKVYRDGIPTLSHVQSLYSGNRSFFKDKKLTLSNEDGKVVFEGRKPGLYLITQDVEAKGYSLMNDFLVSIPYMEDGVYVYDVTAKTKPALEPEEIVTEPEETKDDKLPQTGQLNWPVPALAVGGLALFTLGWYLRYGKKKEGYEE